MTMRIGGTSGLIFPDSSTQNTAATGFGFKNRIINGAMMIDQRNAGAVVIPTSSGYTLDRWAALISVSSKFRIERNATASLGGFYNYLAATCLSAYSVGASDFFGIYQPIEGLNCADLNWGHDDAATVTLSFKVYSSLTGTFGGSIRNASTTRSYPFSYTVSSVNTWTSISITIPGDTSGTWAVDNTTGMFVTFGMGVGSTYSGTAGAWTAGNYMSSTGATSVVGTNGATFYITGVQLEKGSTATSFDYRPYGTELALCQRYYFANTDGTFACYLTGFGNAPASNAIGTYSLPVPARATPTVAIVSSVNGSSFGAGAANRQSIYFSASVTGASAPRIESFTSSAEL